MRITFCILAFTLLVTPAERAWAHNSPPENCDWLLSDSITYQLRAGEDTEQAYDRIISKARSLGRLGPTTVRILTPSGQTAGVWNRDVRYIMTNREIDRLEELFSQGEIALENIKGKRVFETGTGEKAILVNYLVANGVDARGVDLSLTPENRTKPYLIEGDMGKIELPPESFDVIVSSHTLFLSMYEGRNRWRMAKQLKLFHDWLTPGGLIHIVGFDWDVLSEAVRDVEGLRLKNGPYENSHGNDTVTIQKVP